MLSEWYLFTLNNALYAAALATAVWLLTAMLYSIRIASIKRGQVAAEKAGIASLNTMQQQLQQSQESLAETVELMEKAQRSAQDETQRALSLEQLIYQRNQQIAGIIQMLATSFDLGERPLLASEDVKADSLWQQHDKVITQLIDRLRTEKQAKIELQQTCQTATERLAEKEALLKALQTTLDNHTNQLSKLEQALEEQKSMLQQQNDTQQTLSDSLKKYQPEVTRPAEPEPVVNTWQPPIQQQEIPAIAEPLIAQSVLDSQIEPVTKMPQIEETPIEQVTAIETPAPVQPDVTPQAAVEEAPYVSLDTEQQPVKSGKASFGKIKNLFGKKQQPIKTEPQWTIAQADEIETQPLLDTEQQPEEEVSEKAPSKPGKLKGFYNKFTSKDK